jgi:DNA polymerase
MDALSALRLQVEWGADEALAEAPQDRLAARPAAAAPAAPPAAPRPPAVEARAAPAAAGDGAAMAAAAATLEALRTAIAAFAGCALRDTAANLVFGSGPEDAALMLVGDPPGADDDRSGTPFAGPAGAYLDAMLASIGLGRAALRLTTLLPWRPPGDRPASEAEIAACLPFLQRHIELVGPRHLLLAGPVATRALLGREASPRRLRGRWNDVALTFATLPALALPAPARLLRDPAERPLAWAGLRALRRRLDGK